jgi:hypothetical protein
MLLYLVVIAIVGMSVLWIFIVHSMGPKLRLFLARRQWIFMFVHIPVMLFMSSIGGEGVIMGMSSLIGGLFGQGYLAYWGTTQGLSWIGKKTPKYYYLHPQKKRKGLYKSATVMIDKGLQYGKETLNGRS